MPLPRSIVPASSDATLMTETGARSLGPEPASPTHLGPASPVASMAPPRHVLQRGATPRAQGFHIDCEQHDVETGRLAGNPGAAPESPRPDTGGPPRPRPATRGASPPVHDVASAGPCRRRRPCRPLRRCTGSRGMAATAPAATRHRTVTRGSVERPRADAALKSCAVQSGSFTSSTTPWRGQVPRGCICPLPGISLQTCCSAPKEAERVPGASLQLLRLLNGAEPFMRRVPHDKSAQRESRV